MRLLKIGSLARSAYVDISSLLTLTSVSEWNESPLLSLLPLNHLYTCTTCVCAGCTVAVCPFCLNVVFPSCWREIPFRGELALLSCCNWFARDCWKYSQHYLVQKILDLAYNRILLDNQTWSLRCKWPYLLAILLYAGASDFIQFHGKLVKLKRRRPWAPR